MERILDTHEKALAVNLDPTFYGTIAEVGAGQEVARWFFRVGGAAGTIAKTMSAYDMTVSDQIYGKAGRYVSRSRLDAMLDHEYQLLIDRLGAIRGLDTRFFVFADTVSARSFRGGNECHGWVGIRFQAEPGGAPNDVHLHVNLTDPSNVLQQEAIGILGVNLIHAAFFRRESPDVFLRSLHDGLTGGRVEVDLVQVTGPAFEGVDPAEIGIALVRRGQAGAVLIDSSGELLPPTEALHKRAVVIERGHFSKVSEAYRRILHAGVEELKQELSQERKQEPGQGPEPLALFELSLAAFGEERDVSDEDLLQRIRRAIGLGHWLLLTRHKENYHLTGYVRRYSREPVRFVVGVSNLVMLFDQQFYEGLPGGLLEGIGKLFAENVKLYVSPMRAGDVRGHLREYGIEPKHFSIPEAGVVHPGLLSLPEPGVHLYRYLLEVGFLRPIRGAEG